MTETSGQNSFAAFAYYDPDSSSLKTSQATLFEDSNEPSVTLPVSGFMRDGVCYALPTLVRLTDESDSLLLPTPTTQDGANLGAPAQHRRKTLPLNARVQLLPTPTVEQGRNMTAGRSNPKSGHHTGWTLQDIVFAGLIGGSTNPRFVAGSELLEQLRLHQPMNEDD